MSDPRAARFACRYAVDLLRVHDVRLVHEVPSDAPDIISEDLRIAGNAVEHQIPEPGQARPNVCFIGRGAPRPVSGVSRRRADGSRPVLNCGHGLGERRQHGDVGGHHLPSQLELFLPHEGFGDFLRPPVIVLIDQLLPVPAHLEVVRKRLGRAVIHHLPSNVGVLLAHAGPPVRVQIKLALHELRAGDVRVHGALPKGRDHREERALGQILHHPEQVVDVLRVFNDVILHVLHLFVDASHRLLETLDAFLERVG
mmetsp:Transcript_136372/g.423756  ORF Transcript_136372/g.423756 Transcript_136372/m.423756 type:complete len:255 (-) Transcript_136372:607-1371(-)